MAKIFFTVPFKKIGKISRWKYMISQGLALGSNEFRQGHRFVATWTPLATTFNECTNVLDNLAQSFSFTNSQTGLFGRSELLSHEGFYFLKEEAVHRAETLVTEATSINRSRKMVQVFDDLSDTLCQIADMAEFLRVGHPEKRFAISAEDACLAINSTVEQLNTNRSLYESLKYVVENGDILATDAIDRHVAELFLFDFEQSGIHLSEKNRKQVVALNEYILRLGTHFVQGALKPSILPKSAIPKNLRYCFTGNGDEIQIASLFADSNNEQIRELAYRAFLYPDQHQNDLLKNLLEARNELAQLCGFESYAHRAVKGSVAGEPRIIADFLQILSQELKPRSQNDYNVMLAKKLSTGTHTTAELNVWDVPYCTSLTKQEMFKFRSSDYSPYFSIGACMEGLNMIFQSLYGINLKVEAIKRKEAWHNDVIKLGVYDEGGVLGYIYCDFIERPEKPHQDCHFTIRGGRMLQDGTYQLPIVTLLLNLPVPSPICPSLLTPSMVDNLFHEMGHAMHSMLARTKYQHVTGTRCSTDLAEVPSILMEYFASDPRVVSKFARHYKTGELIPDELLEGLISSKHFFTASEMQLQVFYAALDQELHIKPGAAYNSMEVLADVQNQFYGLPYVQNTAWHLRFAHLVGYGAKYYAYLVSRAVASWIWHRYFIEDPLNKAAGSRYRGMVLAHGGAKPSRILLEDYLEEVVTPDSLAKALMLDLDRNM